MKNKPIFILLPIIFAIFLVGSSLILSTQAQAQIPASPAAANATFTTQQVTTNTITDTHPAIVVDGSGKAHIAYEQDSDIYYTTNASGSWITDKIASSTQREFKPSIAVDSAGYAHVAYYAGNGPSYDLYYTKGGLWNGELIQTVSVPHPEHLDGGIALDGAGLPYVVYAIYDGSDYEIEMRYHDGTQTHAPNAGWSTVIITDNFLSDEHPSIVVQSDGKVHIAYQQYDPANFSQSINYATNVSGAWATTEAAGANMIDETAPSITLDNNQTPHIAYEISSMMTGNGIRYATLSGSWITTTISSNSSDDRGASITVDNQNKAHIIFQHHDSGSNYQLIYATNASSVWVTETLALPSTTWSLTPIDRSLAIDSSGYLHATYYNDDGNNSEIYYAKSDQPAAGSGNCAAPIPITCGDAVAGETTGKTNNISSYSCSGWDESGPEEIYAFTLAAGDTYSVTAQLLGFSADLDIFLLGTSGCEAGQCLDATSWGNYTVSATGVAPGTYYISVDGYNGVSGSYTMRLTCETEGSGNQPPNMPSAPSPADQATGVSFDPTLSWTGDDPDGDPVTYAVGFGPTNSTNYLWCETTNTTSCSDQQANTPLLPNTTYYWQVIAEDDHLNATQGPTWSFTTGSSITHKIFLPLVLK